MLLVESHALSFLLSSLSAAVLFVSLLYLLDFSCYPQFRLSEFGTLEIITEVEAEAIKSLSVPAINTSTDGLNSGTWTLAAINTTAASGTDSEGEIFL